MRSYLKKLRLKMRFSQSAMAEKLNISESYYNMIENGERQKKMDLPLAQKLAEIFDVSVDYIMEQESKVS